MPSPKGDPTYIKNKDRFFLTLAKTIALASSHPIAPGGCVLVRDREVKEMDVVFIQLLK